MVMFTFYFFHWNFWGKFGPKSKNCQLRLKFQRWLLLWLNIWSAKGAPLHPAFIGNCPTISHMFQPYVTSRGILLFVSGVTRQDENAG